MGRRSWELYSAFVRNVHHVCMGRGHRSRGRESPFCVKAKEGAGHWRTGGQEQVPTAHQSLHVANALGRRAHDPGVELWQGGSHVVLSLWPGRCSCLHSAESTWPLGQSSWASLLRLSSHHGAKPPCLYSVQGDSHSLSTTTAGPKLGLADTLSVVPPLSTDHGNWAAKVPECL